MDDEKYLSVMFPDITEEQKQEKLNVMEKFENLKWWLSDNHELISYYQMHYNTLLVPKDKLLKSLSIFLEREVDDNDLYFSEPLLEEIIEQRNYNRLK